MGVEEQLANKLYSPKYERSFMDNLLAKDDVNKLRELIKTKELTREQMLEIMYLIAGTEAKLLNYSAWDRHVILKFFVWIRKFAETTEILYDSEDYLKMQDRTCRICGLHMDEKDAMGKSCTCENPKPVLMMTPRGRKTLHNSKMMMQHTFKSLIDLYCNISRTSMSVGGTGILEFLRSKFEFLYTQPQDKGAAGKITGLVRK